MDSIDGCVLSITKILVGVSLEVHRSNELLSWAVGVAAHPNDIIVALHVLGEYIYIYIYIYMTLL